MATKATLINSAGNKVVVDSGSADAQKYFSQGYQLMGKSGKYETPATNSSTPTKTTLPPATSAPTTTPTSTNTLKAQNQQGQTVYVQPGTYNPGVSAITSSAPTASSGSTGNPPSGPLRSCATRVYRSCCPSTLFAGYIQQLILLEHR